MLDQDLQNDLLIENEIERINILFEKNNYDNEQKKWFIESKINGAKKNNDKNLLEVCYRILSDIEMGKNE